MKRLSLTIAIWLILCSTASADYLGVFTTGDTISAPFLVGDSTLAHDPGAPDSFQVLVTRYGQLTASLSDGPVGGWADWIDIHQPFAAGSDSTWMFTELVGDIDNDSAGLHWLILRAYDETEYMQVTHSFQISGTNTNTTYGLITTIEGQTDDIGVAGAGLTAVPWNAAWDAEVESEVDDALGGGTGTALTAIPWNAAWDAEVESEVDDALGAGTGTALTAVPWNSAWDAEVESEVDDALGVGGADLSAVPWNAAWDAEVESEVDDALGVGGADLTAVPWNAAWDAEVESEANDALVDEKLDHLIAVADDDAPVNGSIIAHIVAGDEDWSTFVPSTDALQALRDRGDAEWITAAGFAVSGDPMTLTAAERAAIWDAFYVKTRGTITGATPSSTGFSSSALTQADDYWNNCGLVFLTGAAAGQVTAISDFIASTDSVVMRQIAITPAQNDSFAIVAFQGLNASVNVNHWANIQVFSSNGFPLVNLWEIENVDATDAIQTAVATELATYDGPTDAEMLAALAADVDTNTFDYGDTLTLILDGVTAGCGTGPKNVVFYVVDTSGVDVALANVNVYILNDAETAVVGSGVTDGSGYVTIALDESTKYDPVSRAPGYGFPDTSFTTTAGSSPDTVTLSGYDLVNTATPSSHYTTLTGEAIVFDDTLKGAIVEISLSGANAMYSSIGTMAMGNLFVYADANGDWSAVIPGTDSLTAYVGGTPTYCVRYFHPLIQNGGKFEACGLSIPANGSTTKLRDILAQ